MKEDKLVLRPKKAKGDDGYKVFSVRIKEELVEQLDAVVSKTGYSRNELVGVLLEYALAHCSVEEK